MRIRLVVVLSLVLAACSGAEAAMVPTSTIATIAPLEPVTVTTPAPTEVATAPPTTTTTLPPTNTLELVEITTITGDIAPKSVVATGAGLFFAQNMMYRHTITVYDTSHRLVATIPDSIVPSEYGLSQADAAVRGAPVEAVPTADGSYVYVSNYEMYGPGYENPGNDECNKAGWDESFVYRIDTDALVVDQVIPVGAVPKFLAITPDDRRLLVTNWCSFDMSIIDTATSSEVARVPLGRHPRGIAVTHDGAAAYVAVMGSRNVAVVDLDTLDVDWIHNVGANPRHLVLDPKGRYLYVTLNGEGTVAVVDLATGDVVKRIQSGSAPRSMAISDDGSSLYVVNYESDTVSKIDTEALEVTQTLEVPHHPIGITFDSASREVWVASYTGFITVFRESKPEV
jgi:YVTN family beta-propeller protein